LKTVYLCLLPETYGLDHGSDRTNETASTDVIIMDSVAPVAPVRHYLGVRVGAREFWSVDKG